jgi:hypothetical protein
MAQKAIELLGDETKLRLFKQQAKQRAELFDINRIVPMYEHLYRNLLQTKKTQTA